MVDGWEVVVVVVVEVVEETATFHGEEAEARMEEVVGVGAGVDEDYVYRALAFPSRTLETYVLGLGSAAQREMASMALVLKGEGACEPYAEGYLLHQEMASRQLTLET